MASRISSHQFRSQLGLSLIELLVGIAIGIIGMLAIFQIVTIWTRAYPDNGGGRRCADLRHPRALQPRARPQASRPWLQHGRAPVMGCNVPGERADCRTPTSTSRWRLSRSFPGPSGDPDQISVLYGSSSFFVDARVRQRGANSKRSIAATASRRRPGRRRRQRHSAPERGHLPAHRGHAPTTPTSNGRSRRRHLANFYAAASGVSHFNAAAGTGAIYTSADHLRPRPAAGAARTGASPTSAPWCARKCSRTLQPSRSPTTSSISRRSTASTPTPITRSARPSGAPRRRPTGQRARDPYRPAGAQPPVRAKRRPERERTGPGYPIGQPAWAGGAFLMRNVDGTDRHVRARQLGPEQLALLPLSRLRARDPFQQPSMELNPHSLAGTARSQRRARRRALRGAHRAHRDDASRSGVDAPDGRGHLDRGQRRLQGKRHLGRRPRHRGRARNWITHADPGSPRRFVRHWLSLDLGVRRPIPPHSTGTTSVTRCAHDRCARPATRRRSSSIGCARSQA